MSSKEMTQEVGPSPLEIARAYAAGPAPSANDFDFFLGEWDATVRYAPDGSVLLEHGGRWSAQSLFGGRMVEDRFVSSADGADIGAVITLRTFCEATAQWEMVFLWALQPVPNLTNFVGTRVGDEMHLTAQQVGPGGQVVASRIRFFEITADSFSWEHGSRLDEGEAWHIHTAMTLQRRPAS